MVTLKTLIINAPASLRDTLDQIGGKVALIRHIAAFRLGALTSTIASAKTGIPILLPELGRLVLPAPGNPVFLDRGLFLLGFALPGR